MLMPSIFGENLFDSFFDDFTKPARSLRWSLPASSVMKTDITESDGGYEIGIDLPGYKKEDVQAELKDGYMTITATKQSDTEDKDDQQRFIRRERYSGTCSRSFYVGEDVEQEDIKARFEDGVLKIQIPKKEAKPKVEEKSFIQIEG